MAAVGASNPSSFFVGPAGSDSASAPTHKRTYQACIPCRRRKVRCDLGPVDDPHEPPCVRCRRESKECFFSATRRKRKADGGEDIEGGDDDVEDDYAARNRRRSTLPATRSAGQGQAVGLQHVHSSAISDSQSVTPPSQGYGSASNGPPLFPDSGVDSKDQEVTNETAAELFRTPIHNPGDALHLLFEAAGRSGDLDHDISQVGHDLAPQSARPQTSTRSPSGQHGTKPGFHSTSREHAVDINGQAANPSIIQEVKHDPQDLRCALKAWSRLRFVRAGWFTAREAVSYIDYFYEHLAPMTPITPPDFRSAGTHPRLLQEEPMLTVVLLTISSRYSTLAGPGDKSRSFLVHERLWTYLQSMISRMFWGQEQFGGGFCGAGGPRKRSQTTLTALKDTLKTGSLGSIGTVESLLLLTEWHPRAMHFPPGDDEGELLAPLEDSDPELESQSIRADGPRNRTFTAKGWTEPAWRSDRMCWSLLGTSLALAHEIGIFDNVNGQTFPSGENIPWLYEAPYDGQRADRVRRLLYICATQTSGRLGLPNMFPSHVNHANYLRVSSPSLQFDGLNAMTDISETTQRCWAEITSLMQITNERLFPSKARTRELIRSGEYLDHLKDLQPLLRGWLDNFEVLELPKYSRLLLLVEYEYMRIYVNSLALQAVLEQWTSTHRASGRSYANAANGSNSRTPGALLSPSLVELYKGNEYYIKEVVDASRSLLRNVVEGLLPNDSLKHTPVRTYFRILSGAMFLLKTFALGAKEDEVAISLRLIDHTVAALRTSVVDDVHLCLRIADLVENLTASIRTRFVRLCVQNPSDTQRSNTPSKLSHKSEAPDNRRDMHFGDPVGGMRITQHPDQFGYLFTNDTMQNPLAGISRNSIDLNDDSITIMPPPDLSYSHDHSYNNGPLYSNSNSNNNNNNNNNNPNNNPNNTTTTTNNNNPNNSNPQHLYPHSHTHNHTTLSSANTAHAPDYTPDWLALPLDPLLNGTGGAQGGGAAAAAAGIGFGGLGGLGGLGMGVGSSFDVLDVLLSEGWSNEFE